MTGLEPRYRRALRWYPKKWRAENEDAMVGTLLDAAEGEGRTRPSRGEISDLRSNAFAARLGPLGRISPGVRDRASALAFGMAGGIAIAALVAMAERKATDPPAFSVGIPAVGPFNGWGFAFYAVWMLALVAGLLGWRRAASWITLAAIAVAIVLRFSSVDLYRDHVPTTTTLIFIGALTLLSFGGNPFGSARGRGWIAVGAGFWAAFVGLTLWYQHVTLGGVAGRSDWFIGPLWQWLYWLAPPALIFALVLRGARRSPWAGAILIMLVPVTLFVVFGWAPGIDDLIDRGTLLAIALGIVGAVYFVLRFFRVRIRMTRA